MQRNDHLKQAENQEFDICIIGGGATGAGCLLDAQSRGLKAILIEKHDFASETSSKSTKLIHGGVRYLEQAVKQADLNQYHMVKKALRERLTLIRNAPHLGLQFPRRGRETSGILADQRDGGLGTTHAIGPEADAAAGNGFQRRPHRRFELLLGQGTLAAWDQGDDEVGVARIALGGGAAHARPTAGDAGGAERGEDRGDLRALPQDGGGAADGDIGIGQGRTGGQFQRHGGAAAIGGGDEVRGDERDQGDRKDEEAGRPRQRGPAMPEAPAEQC
ncbi:MAG: FAD-dependent oxidoreductase [Acetobacteraceae bacterium]|nr:MAG: FAD-dependent oxidoreductase [Acetobacteraceae bacterium]